MTQPWHRLFLPAATAGALASAEDASDTHVAEAVRVAEALRAALAERGYQPYDPFPGGSGTPLGLNTTLRLFVAPSQDGQVVVLGEIPEDLLAGLSLHWDSAFLVGWLTENDGGFAVYRDGMRQDSAAALTPYLRGGQSIPTLHRALAGELAAPPLDTPSGGGLPPELHALAQGKGVDPDHASSLFERLSGGLFGKLGKQDDSSEDQQQARMVFAGGEQDLWETLHGQRVRAIAETLNLPGNWRLPSQETVRDAYHVHRLRERNPRMPLIPGDTEVLRSLPNALSYQPVYMGRA